MKKVQAIHSPPMGHWVGDGFPVRSIFSYDRMGANNISPFLLLDYAGPAEFTPTDKPRGVGQHPHRGFETVTIVYQGELEHKDSTGSGGFIGTGDVQWMTAGAGIVHEEFHSQNFTRHGGVLEMIQLWVNLPAMHKSDPASYQTIQNRDIPRIAFASNSGELRVIAGEYNGNFGPAKTTTPMNVWDIKLHQGKDATLTVPKGHNTFLIVRQGKVLVNESEVVGEAELVIFSKDNEDISLSTPNGAKMLLLSGEPINEPVVGMGPFVMNNQNEIHQAVKDFRLGQFGKLSR